MKLDLMGDPHLGKVFQHGVPLHRRSEREELVWEEFEHALSTTTADLHVCMGDVFDRAIVPYDVILRAADLYRSAALRRPETTFVILRGNHDVLRDLERASAFDLFARLIDLPNIRIVTDPVMIEGYLFVGYDPVVPLSDRITEDFVGAKAAFFHADIDGFGNEFNVIPTKALSAIGIARAYTGHVHKPSRFIRDGVDVEVVGSLQPFAHGEEIDDALYVTLSLVELEAAGDLSQKCVRVLLEPGETLEQEIDCLQLTVKRLAGAETSDAVVSMGEFDIDALFRQAFRESGVSDAMTETMIERFHERRLSSTD